MKILICFPPLQSDKGFPTLGQNRQFQYFKGPTYIYPVVPAQAATMLKQDGHDVMWLDCIAEHVSEDDFFVRLNAFKPDMIAFETKTPVIKQEWVLVNKIKSMSDATWQPEIVLFGDHVTALPAESFEQSQVDFVLTGGDYDFLLRNLCRHIKSSASVPLEPGVWFRHEGKVKNTGAFKLDHDLDTIPFIDRELTKWRIYAYENGNYRRTPGTYIMAGRDCWWAKCSFCSWTQLYPKYRVRSVDNVLDEIQYLTDHYPIKEIMDDTGTFPTGAWLNDFCEGMIKRGLHKKVTLDCNMRFNAVDDAGYRLMRKAGFRFLLFGLESANQQTLDRIKKNVNVETIAASCRSARRAGLSPHITLMFGYPWETYADAQRTLELGMRLLKKGYAYTMQATIVIPYPNTPLFKECKEQGLLNTLDWSSYDMKDPVMKLTYPVHDLQRLVQRMYSVSFSPEFILRKILSIRDWDDIAYFGRAFGKVIAHIRDFRKNAQ